MVDMKLKLHYTKDGYEMKYIKHIGDWYMYEKRSVREDWMTSEPIPHYEVVKAVWVNTNASMGIKGGWRVPSSSTWGRLGFTLMTRDRAEQKILLQTKDK